MTDATMHLKTLIEKTPDADLLREMVNLGRPIPPADAFLLRR
jgi:hypothetical protein